MQFSRTFFRRHSASPSLIRKTRRLVEQIGPLEAELRSKQDELKLLSDELERSRSRHGKKHNQQRRQIKELRQSLIGSIRQIQSRLRRLKERNKEHHRGTKGERPLCTNVGLSSIEPTQLAV